MNTLAGYDPMSQELGGYPHMKRFRLDDLPLMVKVGFAPALALVMMAVLAAGAVVLQRSQTHELERVVQTDMPNSLRM